MRKLAVQVRPGRSKKRVPPNWVNRGQGIKAGVATNRAENVNADSRRASMNCGIAQIVEKIGIVKMMLYQRELLVDYTAAIPWPVWRIPTQRI